MKPTVKPQAKPKCLRDFINDRLLKIDQERRAKKNGTQG